MQYRFIPAVLLAVAVIAVAAGAQAKKTQYPAKDRQAYLDACMQGQKRFERYCGCTLEQIQKRMSLTEYQSLSKLPEDEVINNDRFNAAISACRNFYR